MSSSIPNLLTSRGGPRSRGRGRGSGPGGGFASPQTRDPATRRDQSIQATDTDAAVSRLSAVSQGYLDDPFAQIFVGGSGVRRLPIINRGTYTRTTALDILIDSFISSSSPSPSPSKGQRKQIISLGAGTDTRYFRLRARDRHREIVYHEFDFPPISDAKRGVVERHGLAGPERIFIHDPQSKEEDGRGSTTWGFQRPSSAAEGNEIGEGGGGGGGGGGGEHDERGYFCHPLDLRKLPSLSTLDSIPGLRHDLPTLIISECCLCYLEVEAARDVVRWFGDRIRDLGIVLYEPIGVDDAFGQMMVENLAVRGIVMPTVQRYKTLAHQMERLAELGFGDGGDEGRGGGGGRNAETVEDVWRTWISSGERERVDALEGLDEVEEWQMLARHYSVVWGWRGIALWDGRSPLVDRA